MRRNKSLLFTSYFSKCFLLSTIPLLSLSFIKNIYFDLTLWLLWEVGLVGSLWEDTDFCSTSQPQLLAGGVLADGQILRPWAAKFHTLEFYSLELGNAEHERQYDLALARYKQLNISHFRV